MKHQLPVSTSAAALILCAAPAQADSTGFTGFYAPDTWTITGAGIGGSSAIFAADGSELVITGSDGGAGSPDTDVTHIVAADGVWSFDWSYRTFNTSPAFDIAYYLINGMATQFVIDGFPRASGSVSVPVESGDVIGWRMDPTDGIFGHAVLTITDFRAPVPGPPAIALLGLAALPRPPRRRRC